MWIKGSECLGGLLSSPLPAELVLPGGAPCLKRPADVGRMKEPAEAAFPAMLCRGHRGGHADSCPACCIDTVVGAGSTPPITGPLLS